MVQVWAQAWIQDLEMKTVCPQCGGSVAARDIESVPGRESVYTSRGECGKYFLTSFPWLCDTE